MQKFKIICFFICALIFQPALTQAQKTKTQKQQASKAKVQQLPNSLLWEISGNGLAQPSFLYGTFHLLNDSYLDSTPEVTKRFKQSKGIVVETEIDSAAMVQLSSQMIMADNKISALLSPEDYALVSKEVKQALGYELAMLDQMKPMTLILMLSLMEYQKADILKQYKGKPLDTFFAEQGRKDAKKITHLETVAQQFDILYNHFTVENQARQLVEYVKNKEKALEIQDRLTSLYFKQDLTGMWTASEDYNRLMGDEDMAYIVDDRNKNWMLKLPEIIKEQSTFIAVGAMHLPGENGLIRLLQKAGYTVKPIQ